MAKKHQKQESGKRHEKGQGGSPEKARGDDKGETGRKGNRTDRQDSRTDDQR